MLGVSLLSSFNWKSKMSSLFIIIWYAHHFSVEKVVIDVIYIMLKLEPSLIWSLPGELLQSWLPGGHLLYDVNSVVGMAYEVSKSNTANLWGNTLKLLHYGISGGLNIYILRVSSLVSHLGRALMESCRNFTSIIPFGHIEISILIMRSLHNKRWAWSSASCFSY